MFEKTAGYLKETQQELNKVTWPSRNELWQATAVVIVATFLMAAFTALIDMVLSTVMRLLLR
jgi:preprotein translocase subunit SecE